MSWHENIPDWTKQTMLAALLTLTGWALLEVRWTEKRLAAAEIGVTQNKEAAEKQYGELKTKVEKIEKKIDKNHDEQEENTREILRAIGRLEGKIDNGGN